MKHLLIATTLGLLVQSYSYGQASSSRIATPQSVPTNVERYGVDYELKDYVFQNGDSTILNSINLDYLEQFRLQDSNLDVSDPNTGLIVTLFFERRKSTPTTLQLKQ